jgi:rare lipoprotein A
MRPTKAGVLGLTACVSLVGISLAISPGWAAREDGSPKTFRQTGEASWYGPGFDGKRTASGERFNQNELTAAHRTLPLGTEVTVTNLENGRQVVVAVNDRGPYAKGRVLDLSKGAARRLGMLEEGTAQVRIETASEQIAPAQTAKAER